MRRGVLMGAALAVCGACIPACRRTELSGPPTLRPGRDECAHCGMLVNEDRCSSGLLVSNDGGGREHVVFDDIGCMLDYESGHAGLEVVGAFVHDHDSRSWTGAPAAWFVMAAPDRLATPMGSGIVAFSTKDAAERRAAECAGMVIAYERLEAARREMTEARRADSER
jgi:copper chaperone NosL